MNEMQKSLATEILVFMIIDLDRIYNMELPNSFLIAYAMKGARLPVW